MLQMAYILLTVWPCCFTSRRTQVTFFLFHWMKGSPVPTMDSENIHQTYWEQVRLCCV